MAIIFYFITSLVIPETQFSWGTAVGNFFNLQGICCESLVGPFWSLSYEMWFYIILGSLAIALMAGSNQKKLLGFCFLIASVSVFVLGLSLKYLLIWMMGAVAYLARPQKRSKVILLLSCIGFIASCLVWQVSIDSRAFTIQLPSINKDFVEILISFMACLFIQQIILYEPKRKFAIALEKYLGKMAKFSYTLYLSHIIVFYWIIAFIWPRHCCSFSIVGIAKYCAIITISLVSCWILYLLSEKQSPKIKAYLKARLL